MRLEFPYVPRNEQFYPILDITLLHGSVRITTDALIDSGAVMSIFQGSVADYLGLDVEAGKEKLFQRIGGKIIGYVHAIKMRIHEIEFLCTIAFSNEITTSLNIIGRESFFDNFLITFDERNKKVMLDAR